MQQREGRGSGVRLLSRRSGNPTARITAGVVCSSRWASEVKVQFSAREKPAPAFSYTLKHTYPITHPPISLFKV